MTEPKPSQPASGRVQYSSFDQFFKGEFRSVVGLVQSLGGGFEEAQDAAIEAMQKVAMRWSKIDSPRAYVRKVAQHRYFASDVDMRRLKKAVAENPSLLRPLSQSFEESVVQVDFILTAISELPSAQRIVLAWTLQSYSAKEIAEMLDQKEETVRSNLRHARAKLKKRILREPKMPEYQPPAGWQR